MDLYKLAADMQQALDNITIDETTGEVIGYDAVAALDCAFDDKAEATGCYIKSLTAYAAALDAEAKSLIERKKAAERRSERMTDYLGKIMASVGKDKLKSARVDMGFKRNPPSVHITDDTAIPDDYFVIKVDRKPDKTKIKDAIKAGDVVPGAELVQTIAFKVK